ncbi:MAG: hypothetical protein AAGA48_21890 [Myxococcota bacterium]
MSPETIIETLLLYHLGEALAGHASFVHVELASDGVLRIQDDGRGMGIDRTVAGRPYVDRVLSQLGLLRTEAGATLESEQILLHGIGLSLVVDACDRFELSVARGGERRMGHWDRGAQAMIWSSTTASREVGTTTTVRPRDGAFNAERVQQCVERVAARCPTVRVTFAG